MSHARGGAGQRARDLQRRVSDKDVLALELVDLRHDESVQQGACAGAQCRGRRHQRYSWSCLAETQHVAVPTGIPKSIGCNKLHASDT